MKVRHLQPSDLRGKRWAGWLRESTQDQADNVTRQRVDIERSATELGMVGPVRWYSRVGSGEAEGMTELAGALADGKRGDYDVLVVFHTSRFARNRAEATRMKAAFRKAGIVVYFSAQRMISGSFQSALGEGVSEVLDEYDNETKRMWIAGGLRERQKAGKWVGNIPFGYRRALEDRPDGTRGWGGSLEVDPAEYPILRRIVDDYLAGVPIRTIALRLNANGMTRPRAGEWFGTTISALVRNPAYLGELHRYRVERSGHYYEADDPGDGRLTVAGRWPALVTPEEHAALCQPRKVRSTRRIGFTYPLSTVLRCACGRAATGMNNGLTRYYRCVGRALGTGCEAPFLRAADAEDSFALWLDHLTLPDDWRVRIARSQLDGPRTDEAARRERTEARIARLRNLYLWGDLSEDDYRAQSAEARADLAVTAMPNVESMETVAGLLADVGRTWREAPAAAQGLLPRALVAVGEVKGKTVEWSARAELRPLLDLCVPDGGSLHSAEDDYTLRYAV